MKTICILPISSRSKSYDLMVEYFWVPLIQKLKHIDNCDVFLLYNHLNEVIDWDIYNKYLTKNVKFDSTNCIKNKHNQVCILSKRLSAIHELDHYDILWNCNITSIPNIDVLLKYCNSTQISYFGPYKFFDSVETHLTKYNYLDKDNIDTFLKTWPGKTFVGGSGFFLNHNEVNYINKKLNYIINDDIYLVPDDIAIGAILKYVIQDFNLPHIKRHHVNKGDCSKNIFPNKDVFDIRIQYNARSPDELLLLYKNINDWFNK